MKKIIILAILIVSLHACKDTPTNNYVTFSGKIENTTDSILTLSKNDFKKNIVINSDGTFSDTLKIEKEDYFSLLTNGKNNGFLYLKNGFDLYLSANNDTFSERKKYTGYGSSTNNYLTDQFNYGKSLGSFKEIFKLEETLFNAKVSAIKNSFDSIKQLYKEVDTALLKTVLIQHQNFHNFLEENYKAQHEKAIQNAVIEKRLAKGNKSPTFTNYINYKGGKTSLNSFKGKYVYIDVWATWCKPCLAQIPALKELEKAYHGKNIQFVSISIDDERTAGSWKNAATKWKKMVKSRNLTGVQLHAGQDLQFIQDYQISSIPRFILIDPNGNIVDANAPRPADPKLSTIFEDLGI